MTKPRKELLRDDTHGKIAGVCAGVADYFGWEVWLVRIITLSALFLGLGSFVVVLYFAGWVVLGKKSKVKAAASRADATKVAADDERIEVKTRVWQRGEAPKEALKHLQNKFNSLELRLRDVERHVTSAKFQLKQEFNNL
ncbi:MAG: envelope stress response membrane protein PspC [Alkalimonas sp.]|nr:envelope stress response membrane protein PspC [Alkalimonas sp.]